MTDSFTPAVSNARREDRFPATEKLILLMPWGDTAGFEPRRARLLDCSAHGLAVEDTVPMNPGDQFAVYMQLDQVTMVLYTVRHCRKTPAGAFTIGASLTGFMGGHERDPDRVLTSLIEQRLV